MLDSFLDELVNQGACKGALVKTARSIVWDFSRQPGETPEQHASRSRSLQIGKDRFEKSQRQDRLIADKRHKLIAEGAELGKKITRLEKNAKKTDAAAQAAKDIKNLYWRLGAGGAAAGAIAHSGQKMKAEMDKKPLWMHPQGSSFDAAKRTGMAGMGLAGLMHAIARRKPK